VTERRVWTFQLRGGEPFSGQVATPNAFPAVVDHRGAASVWHLRLDEEEASQLEATLLSRGIRVTRWSTEESAEQAGLRARLRAAQSGEAEFPTVRCPGCFWLDVEGDAPCGYRSWPSTAVEEALASHERARADAEGCPIRTTTARS
jgi:hypothetical protein